MCFEQNSDTLINLAHKKCIRQLCAVKRGLTLTARATHTWPLKNFVHNLFRMSPVWSYTCPCQRPNTLVFKLPTRRQLCGDTDDTDDTKNTYGVAAPFTATQCEADHDHICRGCNYAHDAKELDIYSFSFCLTEDNDIHPLCHAKKYLYEPDTKDTLTSMPSVTASHTTCRTFRVEIPYCQQQQQCRDSALKWFDKYMSLKNGVGDV